MRQVVLDTETTGLEPDMGHRIIEIGAVEMVNRKQTGRHFHAYVNPQRDIDDGALEVHGISRAFLSDKPLFDDIAEQFLSFVRDADLVIHNAPFDLSFLDYELQRCGKDYPRMQALCTVTDSLVIARQKHPGQKNNLDALCRRYLVDNSQRDLHGALLDAEILADVYLLMTGGQTNLFAGTDSAQVAGSSEPGVGRDVELADVDALLPVVQATAQELKQHESYLDFLAEESDEQPVWRRQTDR